MNSLNFLPSSSMPPPFALFLFGLDHALVGGADTVHHPLLIAELLDEAVALGDETFDAGFSIGRDLLFDGLGEALHRAARAVVELDEHFAQRSGLICSYLSITANKPVRRGHRRRNLDRAAGGLPATSARNSRLNRRLKRSKYRKTASFPKALRRAVVHEGKGIAKSVTKERFSIAMLAKQAQTPRTE